MKTQGKVVAILCALSLALLLAPRTGLAAGKGKASPKAASVRTLEKAVTVTGVGSDREEALRDALRSAIERATGVFVCSVRS
jgi:ribosomal protein L16/L10AE